MQGKDNICFIKIDAADAEDEHKSMRLKNSVDKVIESNMHYMLRCFDYNYGGVADK